jgi:FMN hydrolase / 5-amino-6-(5-phospho-D-ribitylamino)uracil phosphatase
MPHTLNTLKVKAITLDLDDTLWPIWPAIARAEVAMGDWLRPRAPVTAALLLDAQARVDLREDVVRANPSIAHNMSATRLALIRQGLLRSNEDPLLAQGAFDIFFEHRMKVDLFADVLPALEFLAARFPLVAVSNGNADLAQIGLGRYFLSSMSAHEFGIAKPDARIFHAAATAAGVIADEVLHIGDDAALDVLGAAACGMQTVWVNREGHDWTHATQPHLTVTDLAQLCVLF